MVLAADDTVFLRYNKAEKNITLNDCYGREEMPL